MQLNAKKVEGRGFTAICRKGKDRSGTIVKVREVNERQLLVVNVGIKEGGKDDIKSFYVDELQNLEII